MAEVMILSGAGLSAESGIRTFRDSDGLWEDYDVMEVCSIEGFAADRDKVNGFYDARRADIEHKQPNDAHYAIARLKDKYGDKVAVLTQNVDNLLEKAECKDVIHLHGTLTELRCEECGSVFEIGYSSQCGLTCPSCDSGSIRHNVVMFGEMAPMYQVLQKELNEINLLVVIGTSGQVLDVAYFAQITKQSIINNLDADENIDKWFDIVLTKKASEASSEIEALVEKYFTDGTI
jgi:NAD-dependent deacetylase